MVEIKEKTGQRICLQLGSVAGKALNIANVKESQVFVADWADNVKIDDCEDAEFVLGPVKNDCFIRDCKNITVHVCSGQLRTKNCENVRINVYCPTGSNIEASHKMTFAPYTVTMPHFNALVKSSGLDPAKANLYAQVHDFSAQGGDDADIPADRFKIVKPRSRIVLTVEGHKDANEYPEQWKEVVTDLRDLTFTVKEGEEDYERPKRRERKPRTLSPNSRVASGTVPVAKFRRVLAGRGIVVVPLGRFLEGDDDTKGKLKTAQILVPTELLPEGETAESLSYVKVDFESDENGYRATKVEKIDAPTPQPSGDKQRRGRGGRKGKTGDDQPASPQTFEDSEEPSSKRGSRNRRGRGRKNGDQDGAAPSSPPTTTTPGTRGSNRRNRNKDDDEVATPAPRGAAAPREEGRKAQQQTQQGRHATKSQPVGGRDQGSSEGVSVRLYVDSDYRRFAKFLTDADMFLTLDTQRTLEKQISFDPTSILVAEYDDGNGKKPVIVGTVYILYNPWHTFIYHLCVHPDHRKRNVANRLMDRAEELCKKRGVKCPTLFVGKGNTDVKEFYKRREWFETDQCLCMGKDL